MPALTVVADGLSEHEVRVLDHLARTLRPGFCPSREELSQAAGLGARGYHITNALKDLEDKGYVRLAPGRSRAIALLRRADGRRFSHETIWAPVVGQIGARAPLPAVGQLDNPFADEAIELTRSLVREQEDVFALRVVGDSMVDALVNNGDIVVLKATHHADEIKNGDMVAARVMEDDGQEAATLKLFYLEDGRVRLQPAHPNMLPFYYHPSRVHVYGKVVLVIRQMG
jgi:repressor LexA